MPTCADVALQFGQDLNSSTLGLTVEWGVVMMHLSRAHNTRRRLDAVKPFVFPVIFVVSVRQVVRHIEDLWSEGNAGKQGFCFQHSPSL